MLAIAMLSFACDGDPADTSEDTDAAAEVAFAGTWTLVEEDGMVVSGYGITLTLSGAAFSSAFSDGAGQSCTWSGSVTFDDTTQTWSIEEASGAPCTRMEGTTRTADWELSDAESTLTLDWSAAPAGTVQVHERR